MFIQTDPVTYVPVSSILRIGAGGSAGHLTVTLTDGSAVAVSSEWSPRVIGQIEAFTKAACSCGPAASGPVTSLSFGVHKHH